MNLYIKNYILIFLLSILVTNTFSQSDSANYNKLNKENTATKSLSELQSVATKTTTNSNFDLTSKKKINQKAISTIIKNHKPQNNSNFLLEELPENNDIIGKKYWKGKDVTHKKLESHVSLGTISTKSKVVKVICRDYGAIDGDIIKIYLNEKPLQYNVGLKSYSFVVYFELKEGYNRIDFQALNEGTLGPNTAELALYDENDNLLSSKKWHLLTNNIATIGVIRK